MGELGNVDQKRVTRRGLRGGVEDRWKRKDGQPTARAGTGKRWLARYVDSRGDERTKAFAVKRDAESWLKDQMAGVVRGDGVDPRNAGVTVEDVARGAWSAGIATLTPSTQATYRTLVESYVLPRWGSVKLGDVEHADVQLWVSDLLASGSKAGKPLSPSTVRQTHKLLSQILTAAMRNRQLSANPADHVKLPRLARQEPRFLAVAEVERLAAAVDYLASQPKRPGARTDLNDAGVVEGLETDDDGLVIIPDSPKSENGLIVRLLAGTGLRAGELFGLRVRKVDLEARRLSIDEAVVEVGGSLVVGEPKTHQSRTVPFHSDLVRPLRGQVENKSRDEFVFSDRAGGPIRLRNWSRRVFAPACDLAGLADLTVHDLRHTAASHAISQGMHVKAVQRLLGHASAAMTLDVYSGLFPDDLTAIGE